jgi:hypothetical protein
LRISNPSIIEASQSKQITKKRWGKFSLLFYEKFNRKYLDMRLGESANTSMRPPVVGGRVEPMGNEF